MPPTEFSLEPVMPNTENSKEEVVHSGLQINWAEVMAQRSCGFCWKVAVCQLPRKIVTFPDPEFETEGEIWKGLGFSRS